MWVGGQHRVTAAFSRERATVSIVQEAWWAQGWSGRVGKTSFTPGFDPRTLQPVASRDYAIQSRIVLST